MNCNEVRSKLIQFIDLSLPFQEMANIKNHLKSCTHCSTLGAQVGTTPDFSPLFLDEKPESFWNEFDKSLYEKIGQRSRENKIIRLFRSNSMKKTALAASLAILLLSSTLLFRPQDKVSDLRFPNPQDQGVTFSLSPVGLQSESLQFAPSNSTNLNSKYDHAPVLENVDYRRDSQNGFY